MKKKTAISLSILLLLIVLAITFRSDLTMLADKEYIEGAVQASGMLGPFVFMAVYGLTLLVGLPAIPLTLAGGYIFGFLKGTIYVLIIATAMAAVGFYIPRIFGLSFQGTQDKNQKGIKRIISSIETKVEKNGFTTILLVRPFIGYMILSYAAGFMKKLKFKDFITATIIMNIIFTPAFVLLGDRITEGPQGLILPVTLVILVLLLNKYLKKIKKA